MMMATEAKRRALSLKEKVEWIRDELKETDYRIAKETGITLSVVQNFRNGKADIDNIRFENAIKYGKLYDQIHNKPTT